MSAVKYGKTLGAGTRKTLMERAYEEVKEAILDGTMLPGDFLDESAIASDLQMSRTPVREAVRLLASENLVEIRNGFGACVKRTTRKELKDICIVRKALEVIAAETAVDYITQAEINRLREDFRHLMERRANGELITVKECVSTDFNLHETIVEKCTNHYVKMMMMGIFDQIKRYQCLAYDPTADIEESTRQHLAILDDIEKRDIKAVAKALVDHVDWSFGVLPDWV